MNILMYEDIPVKQWKRQKFRQLKCIFYVKTFG